MTPADEVDESGLPRHLWLPVDDTWEGPVPISEARHLICWCGGPTCHVPFETEAYRLFVETHPPSSSLAAAIAEERELRECLYPRQ